MGFTASDAVAKLEWDFSPFVEAKGVSPEPSDVMIERFRRKWFRLVEGIRGELRASLPPAPTPGSVPPIPEPPQSTVNLREALAGMEEFLSKPDDFQGQREEFIRQVAEATAEVCGNCPTADQIMALPPRPRQAYLGWINGQLLLPEHGTDVMI